MELGNALNIVTFLGGNISHVHLPINITNAINLISAIITIGGAIASPFIYSYVKRAKRMELALKEFLKIAEKYPDRINEPMPIQPLLNREELWRQMEEDATASITEVTEKPKN